jgi:hypothetical protein
MSSYALSSLAMSFYAIKRPIFPLERLGLLVEAGVVRAWIGHELTSSARVVLITIA